MRIDFESSTAATGMRPVARAGGIRRRGKASPRCQAGNVAVEFALAVPVLLFLMLGSAEMGRFVLLNQKMDRVATTVSDLVSRAETISESQIADILTAADQVAEPFDLSDLGVVIVSSVTNADGTGPVIAWQRSGGGVYVARASSGLRATRRCCPTTSWSARARPRSSARSTSISRRS